MTIEPDWLSMPVTAVHVRRVAGQLGQLGGFLLNDRTAQFSMAAAPRPVLPRLVGGCWPVLAVRNPQWRNYLLPAFVLPLQWQRGEADDDRLPPAVLETANRVRVDSIASNQKNSNHRGDGFVISYIERHQPWPDLSLFTTGLIEAESCYASLGMGLRSATSGFPADPRVWASAIWDDRFTGVDLLDEKLETAERWGCRYFFVSPEQPPGETADRKSDLTVLHLGDTQSPNPNDALSDCFAHALLEPDHDNWEACRKYHADIRELNQAKGVDFYDRVLFKHIIERCRKSIRMPAGTASGTDLTHLVTIATKQSQPVAILAGTLKIPNVLVLHTLDPADMSQEAGAVRQQVLKVLPDCNVEVRGFAYDPTSDQFPADFVASICNCLQDFMRGVPDRQLVFDIDRGTTFHKVALLSGVVPEDCNFVSLHHDMLPGAGNRIDHDSEQVFLWRCGDGLSRGKVRPAP